MKGYLLLHGFAGSPEDLMPVARMIKGYGGRVLTPVLAGHGKGRDAMREVDWEDWLTSAENGLDQLSRVCSGVSVIGFSLGALLTVLLARDYRVVDRVVLMSPPVFTNPTELMWGMADVLKHAKNPTGTYLKEYLRRLFRSPVRSIGELHGLMKTVEPVYRELEKPTLILQGGKDDLAHPKGARHIYNRIPAEEKRLVVLHRSRHLLCMDREVERVLEETESFLGLKETEPQRPISWSRTRHV
ncbi:alpha/beta hydrolase [Salinithrix halophila]|uniref:Alpha/beta hydrolase n=1 Tax=Salinithrix halophila TaxID=1485204 RepID=A0ABV8JFI7_9BACL